MAKRGNKVQLSPQLKLGVGRGQFKNNVFKYSGFAFLTLSLALVVWTVTVVVRHVSSPSPANPQVLGETDTANQAFITYTVQKGDTVFNIAQKYNLSWATLATINNLSSPFTLKPGQELKIPSQ